MTLQRWRPWLSTSLDVSTLISIRRRRHRKADLALYLLPSRVLKVPVRLLDNWPFTPISDNEHRSSLPPSFYLGKTYLTNKLKNILSSAPHNLYIAVLSIDDLYLTHAGLKEVAASHPDNILLSGRGQPGTHDIPLGSRLLRDLRNINDSEGTDDSVHRHIEIPVFEKSLFGGEGDRLSGDNVGTIVKPPIDIVLFEGWCVGFCPVPDDVIDRRYEEPIPDIRDFLDIKVFKKEHIKEINENLWAYVEWWSYFDCFIRVRIYSSTFCIILAFSFIV